MTASATGWAPSALSPTANCCSALPSSAAPPGGAHPQPGEQGGRDDEAGRVDRHADDRPTGQQQQAAYAGPDHHHEILQRREDGVGSGEVLLADDFGGQRARGGPVRRQNDG